MSPRRAVFLDRDGTINREAGYLNHASRLELVPGAAEAIRLLNNASIPAIVISNQAGVARGYFTMAVLEETTARLHELLAAENAKLDGIYYCPYHPEGSVPEYAKASRDRKPSPGMIERAAKEHDLDPATSYLIGDRFSDIKLAAAVGAKGILVLTGYGRGEYEYERETWPLQPHFVAADLLDATHWLLKDCANA